jgi:hypothetical protein
VDPITPTVRRIVIVTGWAELGLGVYEHLAPIAPAPVRLLSVNGNGRERIVAATGVVVLATRGTRSLVAVSAVTERLALLAPAPLILFVWFGSSIIHDIVLSTSARVVSTSHRAYTHSRVISEKEALAFIAPFPVALGGHVIYFRYELMTRVTFVSAYESF